MTSIRSRILSSLIPLTALALLITALAIDGSVRHDLERATDHTLLTLARSVGAAVGVELDGELELEWAAVQLLEFGDLGGEAFYVVAEPDGSVFAASPSAPQGPFPGVAGEPRYFHLEIGGQAFRLCTLGVTREPEDDEEDRQDWLEDHPGQVLPPPRPRHVSITVGQSLEGLRTTLAAVRARLLVGLGALFLLLVLLPWWLVSRALRPLQSLSAQADSVGPETPGARLAETGADREVVSLVVALNRALDRLSHALDRQKRFTADAAHELRTPLSAIRAHCEVALRKPRTSVELRETVETVQRTTLRLGELVEGLLTLARFQSREQALVITAVDLAAVAREALRANAPAAEAKGVTLSGELPARMPGAGDPMLLLECLSNLIGNAVRYTPAGGGVRVGGRPDPQPVLWVEDDGIGIPEEHHARIFDRFYRVDAARSRADGGSGLGLSIAQEIARLHRAEIRVTSVPGKGSRFELRLPARGPEIQSTGNEE